MRLGSSFALVQGPTGYVSAQLAVTIRIVARSLLQFSRSATGPRSQRPGRHEGARVDPIPPEQPQSLPAGTSRAPERDRSPVAAARKALTRLPLFGTKSINCLGGRCRN